MRRSWKVSRGVVAIWAALATLVAGLSLATPALAAPETPVTDAPTGIAGTSVTFNGTLNPGASATTGYYFMYAGGTETCEGATTEPQAEQTGKAIPVSAPVTRLEALTEYTYCVVATHLEGETLETAVGSPQTFKTLASAPVVELGESFNVGPVSASVFAFIDAENEATTCVVEFGETSSFGSVAPCEFEFGGAGPQFVPANLFGLKASTTYHYRVVAKNKTGETAGPEAEFTTAPLLPPIVEFEGVSSVTPEGATLEAFVNPYYQETTYSFEYATNESFTGATVVPGGALPAEFASDPVSRTIHGLEPRTTYFFRVVVTNETGTTDGEPVSFETQGAPIVTTGPAELITRTTASVSGLVDPGAAKTLAQVAYIDQQDYEAAVEAGAEDPYAAEGGHLTSSVEISPRDFAPHGTGALELRELKPGTTYHYAIVATNLAGRITGQDATFTTSSATPPVAVTGAAVGVTQTAAKLTGAVETSGLRTALSFEMGDTPSLGLSEPATPGSESGTEVEISLSVGNLPPGTTFYYRAVASNSDGVSYGVVKSFTTAAFSAPPAFSIPALPVLPQKSIPPEEKPPKQQPGGKLAKALKVCSKKPKSKRAACRRRARRKYGKKA